MNRILKSFAHVWILSLCVGLSIGVVQISCQGNSAIDAGNDATVADHATADKAVVDTASGPLSAGAKCNPSTDTCVSGYGCCATCCGTPPPPDSGPRDPGYACVETDSDGMCRAIP